MPEKVLVTDGQKEFAQRSQTDRWTEVNQYNPSSSILGLTLYQTTKFKTSPN